MLEGILQSITNPGAFLERLNSDEKLVRRAVWVVLIVSLLAAVGAYLSTLPSIDAFGDANPFGQAGLTISAISALAITFIFWLVNGLLVRMGAGMDAKPWAIAAYALSPQIIIATLLIVLAAFFPAQLTPVSFDASDPEAIREASLRVQKEFQQSLFGRGSLVLNYLGNAWYLLLIFLGVRAAAGTNKAVTSTILVGLLMFAFILLPFLLQPV
jgi:hypothetical protein